MKGRLAGKIAMIGALVAATFRGEHRTLERPADMPVVGGITMGRIHGTAGSYGMQLVTSKRYKSWKRKHDRRCRNARGGK